MITRKSIPRIIVLTIACAAGAYGLWMLQADATVPLKTSLHALSKPYSEAPKHSLIPTFFLLVCILRFDKFYRLLHDLIQCVRWMYYFGFRKSRVHSPDEDRLINT